MVCSGNIMLNFLLGFTFSKKMEYEDQEEKEEKEEE